MAINTLITIKDAIQAFVDGHEQLQRVVFEADDHRSAYITEGDTFPMLFVAPIDVIPNSGMNNHTIRIYVYERINDDRTDLWENANDTSLILRDIRVWWNSYNEDSDIEIVEDPTAPFVSDKELDKLVGYYADFIFEIPSHGRCDVPVSITPTPVPTCDPATVENSDNTYNDSVASGGTLVVPDSQINVNSVNQGEVVSIKPIDVNLTDSGGTVTPDSSTLTGNTLQIVLPDAAGSIGKKPLKTGQIDTYATRDDGGTQRGSGVDFFTLSSNNAWGNPNRFTDLTGGQTFVGGGVMLDNDTDNGSEILAYTYNTIGTWSICDLYPVNTLNTDGKTDWAIINRSEKDRLIYEDSLRNLDWIPLNVIAPYMSSDGYWWTGTTPKNNSARAKVFFNSSGVTGNQMTTFGKTLGGVRSLAVRYYTYAELGL